MATVKQIIVNLKTSDRAGAGTNGHVYLGLGGREFNLNLSTEDREPGATDSYTLGEGRTSSTRTRTIPGLALAARWSKDSSSGSRSTSGSRVRTSRTAGTSIPSASGCSPAIPRTRPARS